MSFFFSQDMRITIGHFASEDNYMHARRKVLSDNFSIFLTVDIITVVNYYLRYWFSSLF